ncbi:hypothetical protein VNI00_010742 [Paramarasmius palmivorus]|uniref:F-box domain-containing protein n=1 Tax=Paramarasmius palmivorus TaxID=297713 RepID=A0AAW0CFB7_9AGAR
MPNSLSQRPSSSGAAYLGCAPESHNQRHLSEEPFSHAESSTSSRTSSAADAPELSRSMTDDGITPATSSPSSVDHCIWVEWFSEFSENIEEPDPTDTLEPHVLSAPDLDHSSSTTLPLCTRLSTEEIAVHRLPNELLTLIFEQGSCFASPRMFEPKYPPIPVQPVNTISFMMNVLHVCHRWREVAVHTPALWTSLLVARPKCLDPEKLLDLKDFQKPMDWVAKAIKRSQDLPLDVTIDCSTIAPVPAIKQLIPESHRWRSLSIIVPCIQSLPLVLSSLRDVDAPILENLEITANKLHTDRDLILEDLPPFLNSTPKLTHVRLNRAHLQWDAKPLHQLTTLELRFIVWPDYHEFRHLLLHSPTLENLVLHFDDNAFMSLDRQGRAPIPIPCLRSLELRFFYEGSQNVVPLIQLFSIPTLESLILKDFSCADWCRVLPYFRSYAASYPALRALTLSNIKGLIYVDSSTIRAFPHLEKLSLINVYSNAFSRLLLDERTRDGYNALVWPKLHTLTIEKDKDAKMELVQSAIAARLTIGRPIKRLVLDQQLLEESPETTEWLRQFTCLENAAYARI